MRAIVLCGGEGKRLRPLTIDRPKPMILINQKPLMEHILQGLKKHGVKEFFFCTGYKHHIIEDHFGDGSKHDIKIVYSKEEKRLGTGGAIKKLEREIKNDFFTVNGDLITDLSFSNMWRKHKDSRKILTIGAVHPKSPWGIMQLEGELVKKFEQKPILKNLWICSGIYLSKIDFFDHLPKKGNFETETFPILEKMNQIGVYRHDGLWKAIETKKHLDEVVKYFKEDV